MKKIELTKGKFAIVDDDMFDFLNHFSWWAHNNGGCWYAVHSFTKNCAPGKHVNIRMHQVVIGAPMRGFVTRHLDGNGLNNQRSNLLHGTNRQNLQEKKCHRNGQLVGASWSKRDRVWCSNIRIKDSLLRIGTFNTMQEAHIAYISACKRFGI